MNINDLTIGQAKELSSMFGKNTETVSAISSQFVGKYVIVRSRNEGINFGKVLIADSTGVVLENAQRFWYHKPAVKKASWYEGVAKFGPSDDCKISHPVEQKAIIEDYSITACSDGVAEKIKELTPHAQS